MPWFLSNKYFKQFLKHVQKLTKKHAVNEWTESNLKTETRKINRAKQSIFLLIKLEGDQRTSDVPSGTLHILLEGFSLEILQAKLAGLGSSKGFTCLFLLFHQYWGVERPYQLLSESGSLYVSLCGWPEVSRCPCLPSKCGCKKRHMLCPHT